MSESQIQATFAEFAEAWNAHDPAAMAACWTANGNAIHLWGRFVAGRDGVAELLDGEHEGPMRESRYRVAALRVRPLSDTTAVVECDAVIEGVRAPNGRVYELPHRVDAVCVAEEDGRWRFATLHPSFQRADPA
ncbi:MAG TPA: SgcJ/EcaC family oxidoreductase [Thermoanaerobaculia bacterium]|jgi:uncharacterized protein (TIGR02246 family)